MPRDWRAAVGNLSDVGKMVHLAARYDAFDVAGMQGSLLRDMRAAYNDELNIQARRMGCDQLGQMREGSPALMVLRDLAQSDAESIVNTYNYDLAIAIAHIRQETPNANRYVYFKRLATWHENRAAWKDRDIALMTDSRARRMAQQDFINQNRLDEGTARLEPRTAVCPICQGWIARGDVPIRVAKANPPPYHNHCPHTFSYTYAERGKIPCDTIWMGE